MKAVTPGASSPEPRRHGRRMYGQAAKFLTISGNGQIPSQLLTTVLLLAWANSASAQPSATAPAPPPAPPLAQTETIAAGSVLRLLGRDVLGPKGEVVAQVMNVLVDAAGQPCAAVLDYGGFLGVGKRRIAVAWTALRFAPDSKAGAITLALGPDQLKSVPEFKPEGPLVIATLPAAAVGDPAANATPSPVPQGAPAAAQD